jgi:cytochrome P450
VVCRNGIQFIKSLFHLKETVASTITWVVAYLIIYSDVQQKLQEELDKVIGSDRMITVADRSHLPYTCAVIMVSSNYFI